jgi:RNA recognition motif-containing protein
LYVKGFEFTTTEFELETFFREFGDVNSVKIPNGAEFGFVSFHDRESAKRAKEIAPSSLFKGKYLQVSYCETKEQRRANLEEIMDKKAYEAKKRSE